MVGKNSRARRCGPALPLSLSKGAGQAMLEEGWAEAVDEAF